MRASSGYCILVIAAVILTAGFANARVTKPPEPDNQAILDKITASFIIYELDTYDGDLTAAVDALKLAGGVINIKNAAKNLENDLTVPANITLRFEHGGSINGPYTLTIEGGLDAGPYQIFGDEITIGGSPAADKYYPYWWQANDIPGSTDLSYAIQAAFDLAYGSSTCKKVQFLNGRHAFAATMNLYEGLQIYGLGCRDGNGTVLT